MTFKDLGVREEIVETLKKQGIITPTEAQRLAVPKIRQKGDLIFQSQTGTGKTLAYLLPIFEKLKKAPVTQVLIISPTRELAMQIYKVAAKLAETTKDEIALIHGGSDFIKENEKLKKSPALVIGTPGRLLDHLRRKQLNLSNVNRVVLDEADEILRRGFLEDAELLIKETANDRDILLFSATMPPAVRAISARYMKNPTEILLKAEEVNLKNIKQEVVDVREDTKLDTLCSLINEHNPYLALVFCRTKEKAASVALELSKRGYLADELHGDLTQAQRKHALEEFRQAKLQILVATDLAARGLDIEGVTNVYNYDLPIDAESYIHRIGRTGRGGKEGLSVTFATQKEYDKLRKIEGAIRGRLSKTHEKESRKRLKQKIAEKQKKASEKNAEGKKFPKKFSAKKDKPKKPLSRAAKKSKRLGVSRGKGRK